MGRNRPATELSDLRMIRLGMRLRPVSYRGIAPVFAFGWALLAPAGAAFAGKPDGDRPERPDTGPPCSSLDACLAALKALPETDFPDHATAEAEDALRKALTAYGRAAIPGLLRLLDLPEREARKQAAFTLAEIDALTSADLPALVRAYQAGEGRAAIAIAGIATPHAIAALYLALKAAPDAEWLPLAFKRLGPRGVPALMRAFDCRDGASKASPSSRREPCQVHLLEVIAHIFEALGPDASDAVPRLLAIARDKTRARGVRRAAIKGLGAIGPSAAGVAPALRKIARAEPTDFAKTVEGAFFRLRVPDAGRILAGGLTGSREDTIVLRELAELGNGGQPATKRVIALLRNSDWDVRTAAARALGYFGDRRAVPPLVGALDNAENWQLSYVAAESLGRLGDARADGALAALEHDHWYPPVRDSARKARAAIASHDHPASSTDSDDSSGGFFDYDHAGDDVKGCHLRAGRAREAFLPDDDLRRALVAKMTYDAVVVGYGCGAVGQSTRHETPRRQVPSAALEVADGWLLGGNRGEWGGEIVFVDRRGRQTKLVDDNINGLTRLGTRIFAAGGLAHITGNRGMVYEVSRDTQGHWSAGPWRVLPGEPWSSAPQPDGSWLIDTNGGTVVLGPDGELRMATCIEEEPHQERAARSGTRLPESGRPDH